MNHEIMLYAIAQKEQLGFDKAVEECKYRMSRYGVQPNMLVLPPQMLLYMALAPEQKLTYKEGGPAAEARFDAGVAGFEARAFRGCGVFTSEPFEVSDGTPLAPPTPPPCAPCLTVAVRARRCGLGPNAHASESNWGILRDEPSPS